MEMSSGARMMMSSRFTQALSIRMLLRSCLKVFILKIQMVYLMDTFVSINDDITVVSIINYDYTYQYTVNKRWVVTEYRVLNISGFYR